MKLITPLFALTLLVNPAFAQGVDDKVHELCKDAKDYAGCVKSMTTDVTTPPTVVIDQTNRDGIRREMGNACPSGMAYAGNGSCRNIICYQGGIFGSNAPGLGGKGHQCPRIGLVRLTMAWGNNYMPAVNNPNCPDREPQIGALSSCYDGGPGGRLDDLLEEASGSSDSGLAGNDPSDYIPD